MEITIVLDQSLFLSMYALFVLINQRDSNNKKTIHLKKLGSS